MEGQNLIPASQFCVYYKIDVSFLQALHEYDLVPVTVQNDALFIDADHLADVERIIHLHQDLAINLEGIDAIIHLLKRMDAIETEMTALRNRLRLYETQ